MISEWRKWYWTFNEKRMKERMKEKGRRKKKLI